MTVQTIDFVPSPVRLQPTLIQGDSDFWGPPLFSLRVWLDNRSSFVRMMIEAEWEEPKPDHTLFRFTQVVNLYDIRKQKGPGWVFVGFDDQYDFAIERMMIPGSDGGPKSMMSPTDAGLVHSVEAVGDAYGGWFGGADHPSGTIHFNRVRFDVRN